MDISADVQAAWHSRYKDNLLPSTRPSSSHSQANEDSSNLTPPSLRSTVSATPFDMHSIATIAIALALGGAAIANPIDLRKRKFSVHQQEKYPGVVFARNGAQSRVNTLRKFGKAVPSNVLAAAAAGPTGSAPAVPGDAYDSLYLSPATIGNTTVQLDFDTGSADL